jgi:hypothetical protein
MPLNVKQKTNNSNKESGRALSQLDTLLLIGPRDVAIYSQLLKYTQHTAGFTENNSTRTS